MTYYDIEVSSGSLYYLFEVSGLRTNYDRQRTVEWTIQDRYGNVYDSGNLTMEANLGAFTFTSRVSYLPTNTALYAYAYIYNPEGTLLSECTSSAFYIEEEVEEEGWTDWSNYGSYTASTSFYFSLASGTIGYCRFTPPSAGTLVVYSSGSVDMYGWLTNGRCSLGSGDASGALSGGTVYIYDDDGGSSYGGGNRDFGYSYNVSANTAYEIDFHAYSMSNSPSGYIYITFTPSISSWQSPTQMASISGSSYSSYSSTTTINAYRAGYVQFYAPATGQVTFSHSSSSSLYYHLTTSTASAGSGTSFSSAISITGVSSGSSSSITYNVTGGNYYYWYVNGSFSSSGTYSIPWSLTYKRAYTVTYNTNGGSTSNFSGTYYLQSTPSTVTLSSTTPTRTGYTFLGWSTSSSATSASYSAGGTMSLSANTILYAVWRVNSYTISYNANAGSDATKNIPSSQTKTYGTNLTLSTLTPFRFGYTFQGWATNSSATSASYQPGGTYMTNSSATLYAVWAINTYTVQYNANGGTGAPASFTKTYGQSVMLSSTIPTREGHTFLGWSTNSDAIVVHYAAGATFDEDLNQTLYAVWNKDGIAYEEGYRNVYFKTSKYPVKVYLGTDHQKVYWIWNTEK